MTPALAGLLEAMRLKALPRAGWSRVGVPDPESVAAHSWGIAYLVLRMCPPELNLGRALAIATLHDLPEVRVGDITPHDNVSPSEKRARETEAAEAMLEDRPDLLALWKEYVERASPEARMVRDLDKLDMAIQAAVYARATGIDTRAFVESAFSAARDPLVRQWISELHPSSAGAANGT